MLVSLELAVKKEEFSKLVQSNSEPEKVVIEEVIVSSTSKTNLEEAREDEAFCRTTSSASTGRALSATMAGEKRCDGRRLCTA